MFPGCSICTILFEEAILAIRYHLRAMIALEDAIQHNQTESVPELASALIAARKARREAMQKFRAHRAELHKERVMTANGQS